MSVHHCRIMVCQLLMLQLFFSIKASVCIARIDPPAVPKIKLSQHFHARWKTFKKKKKKKKKLKGNAE